MNNPTNPATIVDEVDAWAERLLEHGRSQRTARTYRDALLNLQRFLAERCATTRVVEILPTHVEAWQCRLVDAGCTPACINLYVRAVQYWFAWQIQTDRLFTNPAEGLIRPPMVLALGRCPSVDDMRRLLASIAGSDSLALRDRALLETAYATGARCEELVRLDEHSVNHSSRLVTLWGKGRKERVAPLTTMAVNAIGRYLQHGRLRLLRGAEDQPALFLSARSGRRLESYAVAGVVRRRAAAIGLKMSPHDLRRALASHMLQEGASLAHLRDLLGHADFSHLRSYVRLAPIGMVEAVHNSPLGQ